MMGFWEKINHILTGISDQKNAESDIEIPLATAVLLLEVARSDASISEAEIHIIAGVLRAHHHMSDTEISQTLQLAQQHVEELVSVRDFTKSINSAYNEGQKEHLIQAFWDVAYADGVLDHHEEHWIKKLSDLLYVPRSMVMKHRHYAKRMDL